ncbi:ZYRO0D08800p [Zygosaccharomyces rouxii]|uniref:ZYRO0D08800p n=2 Tax=Zygosaccharomyces rouxii TaxID=4956 RepID=C5DVR4_ZYGRC|nr:uncharacterized protein ZYRO0D08800g [Zygosaccharomyces rouxii]KAH9200795.1 mitochondrial protein [Zygosaccharomyces rouxii]CAQ43574.1 Mitochondrial protein YNR018W [Zygosaccharomyces rouxii]CAR27883.1 ZYRO0D08800p [Zygosaccharomyces rouxii]
MKILSKEEIEAHKYHTIAGGVKGAIAGFAIAGAVWKFAPIRYPRFQPRRWPWSIKTAFWISPPTLMTAICAEEASNKFDSMMYSSGGESADALEEHRKWKEMSMKQKLVEGLSNNKYKIIVGAWAASMYGSWVVVDKDPIMTKAQKAVQARMYAQFITVGLLLASMGLSMYERKLHPNKEQVREKQRWDRLLADVEAEEKTSHDGVAGFRDNSQRVNSKIFKYE